MNEIQSLGKSTYSIRNYVSLSNEKFANEDSQIIKNTSENCKKRLFQEQTHSPLQYQQCDNLVDSSLQFPETYTPHYILDISNQYYDRRYTPSCQTPVVQHTPKTARIIKRHNISIQYAPKRRLGTGIAKYLPINSK